MAEPRTSKDLTAADAAKRVKRTLIGIETREDGTRIETVKEVSVTASEVLSFRDYGTHVVVVTKDGQKLTDRADA